MAFTEVEIAALRDALNAYRIAGTRDGKLPSWKEVALIVQLRLSTLDDCALKEETLRRFANGASISTEALEKIKGLVATSPA